jgi:hypothetical protein
MGIRQHLTRDITIEGRTNTGYDGYVSIDFSLNRPSFEKTARLSLHVYPGFVPFDIRRISEDFSPRQTS